MQPLSKGGTDTADNVQSLCKGCHRAKTRRALGYEAPPF
ncbi:HNH endonuclease [Kitasatospora sp. NBC_00070]